MAPIVDTNDNNKWRDDPAARHQKCPVPADIQTGYFEIKTKMPTLPTVRCDYRIPMGDDGRPLPTAADIVLLFPYPTEQAAISGICKVFTQKHGFTTISLRFPGMGPNDGINSDDHTKWYYWPESGSGEAWIEAIKHVRKIGGFPERAIFASGLSGGGSSAGLFADAYPEIVAAVTNMSGRVFADKSHFNGPVLLMHGAHDYVLPPILDYAEKAKLSNVALTRISFPPDWKGRGTYFLWQHNFNDIGKNFFIQWMIAVADLRIQNAGILPTPTSWPVNENGVRYPSAAVCDIAHQITPSARVIRMGDTAITMSKTASNRIPHGLLIFISRPPYADPDELALDTEYFADHGWAAIAISSNNVLTQTCLKSILASPEFNDLIKLPWSLIIDETEDALSLIKQKTLPFGISLCISHLTPPAKTIDALTKLKVPYLIINEGANDDSSMTGQNPAQSTTTINTKTITFQNTGTWHMQRCSTILRQIDSWTTKN